MLTFSVKGISDDVCVMRRSLQHQQLDRSELIPGCLSHRDAAGTAAAGAGR